MTLLLRFINQVLWLLSHREVAYNYRIGLALPRTDRAPAIGRLRQALGLLDQTWPRWLRRMRPYVSRIQVRRIIKSAAEWDCSSRQVDLDHGYLCADHRSAADVASTIVHEFTHARIDAVGIPYNAATRIRIERVCLRQELAFASLLPASSEREALVEHARQSWDNAPELWSVDALERRLENAGRELGLPKWLVRFGVWLHRRRTSRDSTA